MTVTITAAASSTRSAAKIVRQPESAKPAAARPARAMPVGTKVPHSDSVIGWWRGSAVAAISEGPATTTSR